MILPGGFAHGDYLRTGAMARFSPIMNEVRAFAGRGGPVLGICNGFQILLESGLLPGAMLRNKGLKYRCEHVHVRVEETDTPFTSAASAGQRAADSDWPRRGELLRAAGHAAEARSKPAGDLPLHRCRRDASTMRANPNGSVNAIAGICNEQRNVVGMMPHPERACEPLLGGVDGRDLRIGARCASSLAPRRLRRATDERPSSTTDDNENLERRTTNEHD